MCIEWDVWLNAKQMGVNISEVCNAALTALRDPLTVEEEEEIKKLNYDIDVKVRALLEQKAKNAVQLANIQANRKRKGEELVKMADIMSNLSTMRDIE